MPVRYTLNPSETYWEARGRDKIPNGPIPTPWPPVPGTYIPSPTTTGSRVPKAELPVHQGNLIITAPNTVVENLRVTGRIFIRAANVTIHESVWVEGGIATGNGGLIDCTHIACVNALIEDVTLIPSNPSYYWTGIVGHDFTARRVHTQWTVDSYGLFNSSAPLAPLNVLIEACYGGPLSFFSPDPNHANTDDRVHADHVQIQGGVGTPTTPSVIIRHNAFWGYYAGGIVFPERWPGMNLATSNPLSNPPNIKWGADLRDAATSIIQVTSNIKLNSGDANAVPVEYIRVEHNWMFGAGVAVSLAGGGGATVKRNPGWFIDNIIDGQQRQSNLQGTANAWAFSIESPEYGDRSTGELLGVFTGNINTATGGPARLGRVG